MITFVYCREKEETGNAGEQPASNTLYGYTAKEKASAFFFLLQASYMAKKTHFKFMGVASKLKKLRKQSSISRQVS